MSRSKDAKRYCQQFGCTVAALFVVLLGYAAVFDPWQLFHQPWLRKPAFIGNARFQNAGLINSHEFDSAILGNSMAENFSAKEASRLLGGRFVNLSMAGSLFSERQIVLRHLFRKKKVRQLVVSLDHLPYVRVGQYNREMPPEKFAFLYNANPLDDFRIYLDVGLFRCWNFAERQSCWKELPSPARTQSLEDLYKWHPYYEKAFGGVKAWCDWSQHEPLFKDFLQEIVRTAAAVKKGRKELWPDKVLAECRSNASSTFEQYLLPMAKEHPETQFLLFFPPFSRLWYSMQKQYYVSYYAAYLHFVEDVVKSSAGIPNVLIFGFDNMDFVSDIANYKDQSHYHKDVNSRLLQLMAVRSNVLTPVLLDGYLAEISSLAQDYDLQGIAREFAACLSQKQ